LSQPQQDAAGNAFRYEIQGRTRMTVVPNRPVDGNRRPKVRSTAAQRGTSGYNPSRTSDLPPVLFRLPNLNGRSQRPGVAGEQDLSAASSVSGSLRGDASPEHDKTENRSIRIDSGELAHDGEEISETTIPETVGRPTAPVAVERRSLISRLMTNAMLLGVIGLGATWIYVVAKNVRSSATTQVARLGESENLASSDHSLSPESETTMEDMVANAERLALNQNGSLPTHTSGATEPTSMAALPSSNDLMAEATAAVEEVQADVETSNIAIKSDATAGRGQVDVAETATSQMNSGSAAIGSVTEASGTLNLPTGTGQSALNPASGAQPGMDIREVAETDSPTPSDFEVTMPTSTVKDQMAAIAASTRSAASDDSKKELSTVPPAQGFQADTQSENDTPQLPPASTDNRAIRPAQTATPSGLTPPLAEDMDAMLAEIKAESAEKTKSSDPTRRFSKSPSAVTDWLQYLPPLTR
jgi:hypothetical protein